MPLLIIILLVSVTLIEEVISLTLLFAVVEIHFHPSAVTILFILQTIPAVILAPFIGNLIDKVGARLYLLVTGVSQSAILIWIAFATKITALYVASALLALHTVCTGAAIFALIVPICKRLGFPLIRANTTIETAKAIGFISGPVIAGLAIEAVALKQTLILLALWFATIIIALQFLKIDTVRRDATGELHLFHPGYFTAEVLTQQRPIFYLLLVAGCVILATSLSDVLFIFLSLDILSGTAVTTGILISLWSFGMICSATAMSFMSHLHVKSRHQYICLVGGLLMGLSLLLTGIVAAILSPRHAYVAISFLFFSGGMGNGLFSINVRQLIHLSFPEGQHGRGFSFYIAISRLSAFLGFIIGGLFSQPNVAEGFMISGILAIAASIYGVWHQLSDRK